MSERPETWTDGQGDTQALVLLEGGKRPSDRVGWPGRFAALPCFATKPAGRLGIRSSGAGTRSRFRLLPGCPLARISRAYSHLEPWRAHHHHPCVLEVFRRHSAWRQQTRRTGLLLRRRRARLEAGNRTPCRTSSRAFFRGMVRERERQRQRERAACSRKLRCLSARGDSEQRRAAKRLRSQRIPRSWVAHRLAHVEK